MHKLALVLAATAAMTVPLVASAAAQTPVPGVPDPTDCHAMNKLLHIDNVRNCDPLLGANAQATTPPPPVSVQRRSDGSICVTVSLQVPQCVGPIA
ncbi:MAG: hypothetical protein ABR549_10470 [Mycobacteriales bacterium]